MPHTMPQLLAAHLGLNPKADDDSLVLLLVNGLVVKGKIVSPSEMSPHVMGDKAVRGSIDPECICLVDATVNHGGTAMYVPALVIDRAAVNGGIGGITIEPK